MRKPLSITVNGKRRRALSLAIPEPIPKLKFLWLLCDGRGETGFSAGPQDYKNGAYHLRRHPIIGVPGTYRVRAVEVRYTDYTTAVSELADEVVIQIPDPARPEPGPTFKAM